MAGGLVRGEQLEHDVEESCDVCVIGSGAGGAVMAKELAEGGLSVVVLEEGGYHTREEFTGRPSEMIPLLYRDMGMTSTVGNTTIIVPLGRAVGGTTVINMGTCFRIPDDLLLRWRAEYGLDVDPDTMAPYFERVERFLGVEEVKYEAMGRNALFVKRGVEALGLRGRPIRRNAQNDCGCGVCAFGCPKDSKKAMHISYIPAAIRYGARVYANCRADRVIMRGGRVAGVLGTIFGRNGRRRMRVHCKVLVVAAGAIYTPVFLLRNRLANRSGQVGRNLTLHPAVRVAGLTDEIIDPWKGVPQSYYVDDFAHEGIMLEGIFVPPSVEAMAMPFFGRRQQEIMANYRRIATFGLMVSDTSRGRVRAIGHRPLITYFVNREDTYRLVRGIQIVSRILFAAGARRVYPGIYGHEVLDDPAQIDRIRPEEVRPSHLELSAYHPLGTARMGRDPRQSVVNGYGQSHDIVNLFIADGSIFPSCLGVNPQLGIMAFATRFAHRMLERWEPAGIVRPVA